MKGSLNSDVSFTHAVKHASYEFIFAHLNSDLFVQLYFTPMFAAAAAVVGVVI